MLELSLHLIVSGNFTDHTADGRTLRTTSTPVARTFAHRKPIRTGDDQSMPTYWANRETKRLVSSDEVTATNREEEATSLTSSACISVPSARRMTMSSGKSSPSIVSGDFSRMSTAQPRSVDRVPPTDQLHRLQRLWLAVLDGSMGVEQLISGKQSRSRC